MSPTKKLVRTNLTVAVWEGQLEIFRSAAKSRHQTLPDYVRERLLRVACDDAGVSLPIFPEFQTRHRQDNVRMAAQALGLDESEFRRRTAEEAADRILDKLTKSDAPTTVLDRMKTGTGGR